MNDNRSTTAFFSHISMIEPKGKFLFYRDSFYTFLKKYCNSVPEVNLGIGEKPEAYIPILVDIDLKSHEDKDLYDENIVLSVIRCYQQILSEIIIDVTPEKLICVLLEKKRYKVKDIYKNGFHLHFPNIFLDKENHENILLPKVKIELLKNNVFAQDKIDSILDDHYLKNVWLMYGSRKSFDQDPYLVSRIFDQDCNQITLETAFKDYKIYDNSIEIKKTKDIKYYLPYILSIILNDRQELVCEVKQDISLPTMNISKQVVTKKNIKINYKDMKSELLLACKLLKILNIKRVDNHNDWFFIGVILYNISHGSEDGLKLWIGWSRNIQEHHKSRGSPNNFNDDVCQDYWEKMIKKDVTIGTLKYLAKTDNYKEYNKIIKDEMSVYIKKCCEIGGNHYDIAKAMYEKYSHEFVCSSTKFKTWYKFKTPVWVEIEEGIDLKKKISTEIVRLFDAKIKELQNEKRSLTQSERIQFAPDDETESVDSDYEIDVSEEQASHNANVQDVIKIDKKIERLYKIIGSCKQAPYKNNIMRECMELFHDPQFESKLNSNKYIIAFKNGVYDLNTNSFRDGNPADCLSLRLNVNYKKFKKTDTPVKNVIDFFEKVIPDKSVRDYFLHTTSEVFVGGNHRKYVFVWQGCGDNGKSVTQNLLEKMLGEYSIKLPTSLLVGKRTASGAACPELARAGNGVRWAVAQEPEKKDILNTGLLKELSGNDSFYARALFKDGRELTPMFKMVLICNHLPQIPNSDKATWNRIRIIPFESTFTDDAPEDPDEQLRTKNFPKESDFEDKKLPGMFEALAWYLLQYRKEHTCSSLVEPEKVRSATAAYRRANDIYRQFIEEYIVEEDASKISLRELYHHFKDWHKNSIPGQTIPIKNDLKEYIINEWGEPEAGVKWSGYRVRNGRDDLNEELNSENDQNNQNDVMEYE